MWEILGQLFSVKVWFQVLKKSICSLFSTPSISLDGKQELQGQGNGLLENPYPRLHCMLTNNKWFFKNPYQAAQEIKMWLFAVASHLREMGNSFLSVITIYFGCFGLSWPIPTKLISKSHQRICNRFCECTQQGAHPTSERVLTSLRSSPRTSHQLINKRLFSSPLLGYLQTAFFPPPKISGPSEEGRTDLFHCTGE